MDRKTLRILEFDKIREQLASHTAFSLGRERALWLEPVQDLDVVMLRQKETKEALDIVNRDGGLPLGGIKDIKGFLQRAQMGSTLLPEELLDIAGTLHGTGRARRFLFDHTEHGTQLADLAERLEPALQLQKNIENAVGDDGEVLDSASDKLRSIRSRMRNLQNRIKDRLNTIVQSTRYQKVLQDAIVTLRNGRYVVPVKSEYKGSLPGIVHDQSGSGQTLFIEPQAVVETNNQLRRLEAEEDEEIEKILHQLTLAVSAKARELVISVETLGRLDFIFAKAYLASEQKAICPRVNTEGYLDIRGARHPLLKGKIVPIDVWLGRDFATLVITGPNTGGKTVALKTVGLLTLMCQAGLHIPCDEGTEMNVFEQVFADIGDEQSIEQSLSTFSSHMANIVRIMDEVNRNSLVLLDELGAGTDPTEGAALAMALLQWFHNRGCRTIATTHYSELKAFAFMTEGLENASVRFDVETLEPTYELEIGLPGRSNAFAIAKRLGLHTHVVEAAKAHLTQEDIRIDDMIQDMEESRRRAIHEKTVAERTRIQVESEKDEYEKRLLRLEREKDSILAKARHEAAELLKQAKSEADQLLGQLRSADKQKREQIAKDVRRVLEDERQSLTFQKAQKEPRPAKTAAKHLRPGSAVRLHRLQQKGQVLELTAAGEALVQVGALRITLPVDELSLVEGRGRDERPSSAQIRRQPPEAASRLQATKAAAISTELDLRGMTVEEATNTVDKYLDDALLAGLSRCRLIHGKGTGALRQALHVQLEIHPHVKAMRLGGPDEGGDGVTVAELG
ncbi:MAG: endonuclease MutS2 [Firmicutes bacterium]|nr:endonuclease MutS2 [Bacillota bacterium]